MTGWASMRERLRGHGRSLVLGGTLAAVALVAGGVAVAEGVRPHSEPASAGRVIQVRREVVRAPPYVPPPVTEEARLDVRPTGYLAAPDPALLSVDADAAWRAMQAEDAARMQSALTEVRAADARADRELAAALARTREPAADAAASGSSVVEG